MKKLFALLFIITILFSCNDQPNYPQTSYQSPPPPPTINIVEKQAHLGDNLDLKALGELVRTSRDATSIEKQLNSPGSINNIDLNGDGNVDYIKVTEYPAGPNTQGFSFTVDLTDTEKQEIATIEISQNPATSQATMNINGNQNVYGAGYNYSSNYSFTDLLIMSYLFHPHHYYCSPYRYGYYPSYWHSYRGISYNSYSTRARSTYKTTTYKTTTTTTTTKKSPNSNQNSSFVSQENKKTTSLSNPTKSQKSFQVNNNSGEKLNTSGFGTKTASSTPSQTHHDSPHKSSSPSSSKSKSSFGSRRK